MRSLAASTLATLVLSGCSGDHLASTGPLDDAGRALSDASPPPDASPPDDAGPPDVGPNDDAGSDSQGALDATNSALDDAADASALADDCATDADHPVELRCTGLYSDWRSRTIDPRARAYSPGVPLWSDGAEKNRYIWLPPGTQIDTNDPDEWNFPIGTKLWKEFRVNGQPVETRLLWKRNVGVWFWTTYAWSLDGRSATELPGGLTNWNGTTYEIPSQASCTDCHQGRLDGVLGFEAVSLSEPTATGLTMAELVRENLLTNPPAAPIVVPGNATESAALAWLHANCGMACHNRTPLAGASASALFMRLEVARMDSVQSTDAWLLAVGQPSMWQPNPGANMLRIDPGNVANSAIYFRDSHRDAPGAGTLYQMPPIDTHVVPQDGVALVGAWIRSMAGP
jgi:hypothetical protein